MSKYVQRLVDEWRKHGKLIIAVDFDDTLEPFNVASMEECDELMQYLVSIQDKLHIIIWTASDPARYLYIKSYCKGRGLNVVGVNVPAIEGLKYGTPSKPYFNLLIDDRAGKEEAINNLKQAYNIVYGVI